LENNKNRAGKCCEKNVKSVHWHKRWRAFAGKMKASRTKGMETNKPGALIFSR